MATVASLLLTLSANSSQMTKELAKANKAVEGFGKRANKTLKGVGRALGAIAASSAINDTIRKFDDISKRARGAGVSVETYQRAVHALGQQGFNERQAQQYFFKTQVAVGRAKAGLKEFQDAFTQLGLDFDKLAQLSPEDQFIAIQNALSQPGIDRAYLATKLYGEELSELKVNAQDYIRDAAEINVVSGETAVKFEKFNDSLDTLNKNFTSFIATGLGPAIEGVNTLSDGFNKLNATEQGLIKVAAAVTAIGVAFKLLGGPITLAVTAVYGLLTAIGYVKNNQEELKVQFSTFLSNMALRMDTLGLRFKSLGEGIKQFYLTIWGGLISGITGAAESAINAVIGGINGLIRKINSNPVVKKLFGAEGAVGELSLVSLGDGNPFEGLITQSEANVAKYKTTIDSNNAAIEENTKASKKLIEAIRARKVEEKKASQPAGDTSGSGSSSSAPANATPEEKTTWLQSFTSAFGDADYTPLANKLAEGLGKDAKQPFTESVTKLFDFAFSKIGTGSGSKLGIFAALIGAVGSVAGAFNAASAPTTTPTSTGGGRANGGPVRAGVAYTVGERGREKFVPNNNGYIVPNHEMGGQTINLNVTGDVKEQTKKELFSMIPELSRQLGVYRQERGGRF